MDDLPLMHRWLNEEHVARWYDIGGVHNPSYDQVVARYQPRIAGEEPTDCFIVLSGKRRVAYIQKYFIRDDPGYAAAVQVEESAVGIDLFIGEPDYVNVGLGRRIVREFTETVVFADETVEAAIIAPDPANAAAIRAYEKAGFQHVKTVEVPGGLVPEYVMRLRREQ
jgi:aminoglycoside 6'-N-acetyltransferase